ncbi:MAG: sigma-70 family RNA polymerase sigma factor [Acidimicrobiales bacterium]|nr:sigma-70 family RNA polymerase sigma factor [Acidimicrobiales bacterium]
MRTTTTTDPRSGQVRSRAPGAPPPERRREPSTATWPQDLVDAYEEQWLSLTRLAYLMTGNRAVAEELVQDVFLAARPAWGQIDNPAGYLRASVVNATRDWGRHQQVVARHQPSAPEVSIDHPDELWDALQRLDERRRTAVVLRYYADLPDDDIAGILGCRRATVRTLIHRALRDLRREMKP